MVKELKEMISKEELSIRLEQAEELTDFKRGPLRASSLRNRKKKNGEK